MSEDIKKIKPTQTPDKRIRVRNSRILVAPDLSQLRNAIYTLRIHGTLESRLSFARDWPAVAEHIFGEELLSYDHQGTPNRIRRAWLEKKAEERRAEFIHICNHFEELSVKPDKYLDRAYTYNLLSNLGYEVAKFLYADDILDLFFDFDNDDDYAQGTEYGNGAQNFSPEMMAFPMMTAPFRRGRAQTDMDEAEPRPKKHEVDPLNPFSAVALPNAREIKNMDLSVKASSIPRRGLSISWAQLMYRYEDKK